MARAASAFFGGPQIGNRPIVARFNHDGRAGRGYSYTPVVRGADGKVLTGEPQPLTYGFEGIADIGSMLWGPHCYRPYNDSCMVPYGQPIPSIRADAQGEFSDHIGVMLYLRSRGLCKWMIGSVLTQNAWHLVWTRCGAASEAQRGLIPVIIFHPSLAVPIASRNGELSYQPVLEITGWVVRDPLFGERSVPAPIARISSDSGATAAAQPVALAQPVPIILPPEQVNVPVQEPVVPVTVQHPQPAAVAVAPSPVPDPFATMIPLAAAAPAVAAPAPTVATAATPTPTPTPALAPAPAAASAPSIMAVAAPSAAPRF